MNRLKKLKLVTIQGAEAPGCVKNCVIFFSGRKGSLPRKNLGDTPGLQCLKLTVFSKGEKTEIDEHDKKKTSAAFNKFSRL